MGFGIEPIGPFPDELRNTWETIPAEDAHQADIVLREAYDMQFDIFQHTMKKPNTRPLAVIAYHEKEDTNKDSLFEMWALHFFRSGIYTNFGLDLVQFLNLPADRAQDLLQLNEKAVDAKRKETERLQNEMSHPKK